VRPGNVEPFFPLLLGVFVLAVVTLLGLAVSLDRAAPPSAPPSARPHHQLTRSSS
jgi:hypothetical protein